MSSDPHEHPRDEEPPYERPVDTEPVPETPDPPRKYSRAWCRDYLGVTGDEDD